MSQCERVGKWIGGCRFEPRYDLGEPDTSKIGRVAHYISAAPDLIKACRPSTYIHDICIRCGKVTQRPTTPNARDQG